MACDKTPRRKQEEFTDGLVCVRFGLDGRRSIGNQQQLTTEDTETTEKIRSFATGTPFVLDRLGVLCVLCGDKTLLLLARNSV